LEEGQIIRDVRTLELPGGLVPGIYHLRLGRRVQEGWLPVHRGPVRLGQTYPLATVGVTGRPANYVRPQVGNPMDARFKEASGGTISLLGYDLIESDPQLALTLYWQPEAPVQTNYKIFVHLVGNGPSDIRAQTDLYPHLPTSGWLPGEYLSDELYLDLPSDLPPGRYELLVGFYDESTGQRLQVTGAIGQPLGDSLLLQPIDIEP
jgi:hypothetical protein